MQNLVTPGSLKCLIYILILLWCSLKHFEGTHYGRKIIINLKHERWVFLKYINPPIREGGIKDFNT